jgi:hypothetical protein
MKELREQAYFGKQPSPGGKRRFSPLYFLDHCGDTAPLEAPTIARVMAYAAAFSPTTNMAAWRTPISSRRYEFVAARIFGFM